MLVPNLNLPAAFAFAALAVGVALGSRRRDRWLIVAYLVLGAQLAYDNAQPITSGVAFLAVLLLHLAHALHLAHEGSEPRDRH